MAADAKAVLFDVDFTLIAPGPTFRGEGYCAFASRYGMALDAARFSDAVIAAAPLLDGPEDTQYDDEISSGTRAGSSRGWAVPVR